MWPFRGCVHRKPRKAKAVPVTKPAAAVNGQSAGVKGTNGKDVNQTFNSCMFWVVLNVAGGV